MRALLLLEGHARRLPQLATGSIVAINNSLDGRNNCELFAWHSLVTNKAVQRWKRVYIDSFDVRPAPVEAEK
jgi:hypothetical protein